MNVVRRRLRQAVAVVYAMGCLGCAAMVIGPAMNDHAIADGQGRALAQVLSVGWRRTIVEFQDAEGLYHTPPQGVAYPSGLDEGQRVWVEYAVSDPELVKVSGRRWTLAIIPALSTWVVVTVAAAGAWWLIGRFS